MTATLTNTRVTVEDGWAVRNLPNGDQVRARLVLDQHPQEPERGEGMWNNGVTITSNYQHDRMDDDGALNGVLTTAWSYGPDWEDDDETVLRFLRIFRGVQHAEIHRRYRETYYVIASGIEDGADAAAIARSTWDEWLAWADGDVYGAVAEYRTLADAMGAEDFDEGWTDYESLWGGYGDDGALSVLEQVLYVPDCGDVDHDSLPAPYEVTSY